MSSADGFPTNESPDALFYDTVNLMACTTVGAAAYGIMFTLYLICGYFLWAQMSKENRRRNAFYLGYTTVMFILGTLYVASNAWIADLSYVQHRLYSDGPAAYALSIYSEPNTVLGSVCWMLINFMADGLILWRFMVLHKGVDHYFVVILFPSLIYAGCITFGLLTVIQSSLPEHSFRSASAINFALVYFSLSISLTTIATTSMLCRLLVFRRHVQGVLGSQFGKQYTSIAAMMVESAALYAVFCLVFVILYALDNTIQWIFLSALAQIQIIAPLLIIFRVSQGKAWTRNTRTTLMSSLNTAQSHIPASEFQSRFSRETNTLNNESVVIHIKPSFPTQRPHGKSSLSVILHSETTEH
ncbi:hypothetical protein BDN72DRAFT_803760 [Pluteus cervinus]|uniref:Uncharacterized protein n=1 Tax=Pluteus cervinus TaxID=181527 RepID=A0ACD3AAN8_9AGAR|nr:hypothetical protein BDN72DRAFT_803760 [Pluteus cervinus]